MQFGRLLSTNFYTIEMDKQDAHMILPLHSYPSIVSDDDFSSQSDVLDICPCKRTHINLEVPTNSQDRPLVRRHASIKNWQSADLGQQSGIQTDLHQRLQAEPAW